MEIVFQEVWFFAKWNSEDVKCVSENVNCISEDMKCFRFWSVNPGLHVHVTAMLKIVEYIHVYWFNGNCFLFNRSKAVLKYELQR